MSVTMRPLGCSLSACGSSGGGGGVRKGRIGSGRHEGGQRYPCPGEGPPPSHLGELSFCLWMDGREHWALELFVFCNPGVPILLDSNKTEG